MGSGMSTAQLPKEEVESIIRTWRVIMESPEENGITIFVKFLNKYNYYSKFEKFKGIPISELPKNGGFRRHSAAIIYAINNVISNLGKDSIIKSDLKALGKLHAKKNITEQEFQELRDVILEVLEEAFRISNEDIRIWEKTLNMAFTQIFDGLRHQ